MGFFGLDRPDDRAGDGVGVDRHDGRLGQCAGEFGVTALELAVRIIFGVRLPWRDLGFDEPRITDPGRLYQNDANTELPYFGPKRV